MLVSDIGMPDEDRYALIRTVRALLREDGGQISAIAPTAYAKAADCSRAFLRDFHPHVAKPVEAAGLVAAAENLAGRTWGAD